MQPKSLPRRFRIIPLYEELVQFSYLLNEKCSWINVGERDIWMDEFLKKDWVPVFQNV